MRESLAIIAALPREVKHLVRGWQEHRLPGKIVVYSNDVAVVACAGMGVARATLAVQAAMSIRPVTALLSVGLAGACDPAWQVLASAPGIASVDEKRRLFASYKASAVDMEAATVARIARAHELGFHAIKAISDEATFELQELARFATHDGQFREAAFAAHATVRPQMWAKLFQLAGNSKRAIEALTAELESQINLYRQRV
jgi:adenosylhomocysteine nucleosidase